MFEWLITSLACPKCKTSLIAEKLVRRAKKISSGFLLCKGCQERYRIVAGIPVLLPPGRKAPGRGFPLGEVLVEDPASFATKRKKSPMEEVLEYFGKERVLLAVQRGEKLPPKSSNRKISPFNGPVSPAEKQRGYRYSRKVFFRKFMTEVMEKSWWKDPPLIELINNVEELKPNNLLDFATGPGAFLCKMLSCLKSTRIIGLEISFTGSRMTQAEIEYLKGQSQAGMVEGDARQMPFPADQFDCVTTHVGPYHIPKYRLSIEESYRVLKSGGWFLGTFHNEYPGFTNGKMTKEEEAIILKYASLPIDIEDVKSVCKKAGFQEVLVSSVGSKSLVKAQKPDTL